MLVASGDTPAIAGTSRTSSPCVAENAHEVRGQGQRQLRRALEVERVGEEDAREACGQVTTFRRAALAVLDLGEHPVPAVHDREVLG